MTMFQLQTKLPKPCQCSKLTPPNLQSTLPNYPQIPALSNLCLARTKMYVQMSSLRSVGRYYGNKLPPYLPPSTPFLHLYGGDQSPQSPLTAPPSGDGRTSWRRLGGWLPPTPAKSLRLTFAVLVSIHLLTCLVPRQVRRCLDMLFACTRSLSATNVPFGSAS